MFALVDCNNFYASCERAFNPKTIGKPLIVLSNNDGCIIARSEEAKKLGLKMGDPVFLFEETLKKYDVKIFSSNYPLYGDMSERVMNTLTELAPTIEIYSIDEAFLDLQGMPDELLDDYAIRVKKTVGQWTGIPISVGIASTKTLAKLANQLAKRHPDFNKQNICVLHNNQDINHLLRDFAVEKVWGVGDEYAVLLKKFGICSAYDLKIAHPKFIREHTNVIGERTVNELNGVSCIPIEQIPVAKKAICHARSFGREVSNFKLLSEAVANYAAGCARKLRKQKSCARIVTTYIETNRFKPHKKQYAQYKTIHLNIPSYSTNEIIKTAMSGLKMIYKDGYDYKKAGVMVDGLVPESQIQTNWLESKSKNFEQRKLMRSFDQINNTIGKDMVRIASQGFERKWKLRQEKLSPCYTSKWSDLLTIKI
jgi:DNA polymerase V